MAEQGQLPPGTRELLILRAVSLGPRHGYGILLRFAQISGRALMVEQGATVSRTVSISSPGNPEDEAFPMRIDGQSFTIWRLRDENRCRTKQKAGTGWQRPLTARFPCNRKNYETP
jgi:hypothetical protein